jgi:hypothetical protein
VTHFKCVQLSQVVQVQKGVCYLDKAEAQAHPSDHYGFMIIHKSSGEETRESGKRTGVFKRGTESPTEQSDIFKIPSSPDRGHSQTIVEQLVANLVTYHLQLPSMLEIVSKKSLVIDSPLVIAEKGLRAKIGAFWGKNSREDISAKSTDDPYRL